ncbi:hypothetical protein Q8F55_002772 [Vanrija albida]|uniref:Uncharacterized protein n=1 Tax=Vanrija albida TaxID=181172 RepID=A0ABR3QAR8_9TREE
MTKRRRAPSASSEDTLDFAADLAPAPTPAPVPTTVNNHFAVNVSTDAIQRAIEQQAEALSVIQRTQDQHTDLQTQHAEALKALQSAHDEHDELNDLQHWGVLERLELGINDNRTAQDLNLKKQRDVLDAHGKMLEQLADTQKQQGAEIQSLLRGQTEQAGAQQLILATLKSLMEKTDQLSSAVSAGIAAKTSRDAELENMTAALDTNIKAFNSKVNSTLTGIDSKVSHLSTHSTTVDTTFATLIDRVSDVDKRVNGVSDHLMLADNKSREVDSKIASIISSLSGDQHKIKMDKLDSKLATVEQKLTTLGTKMAVVDTIASKVIDIHARQASSDKIHVNTPKMAVGLPHPSDKTPKHATPSVPKETINALPSSHTPQYSTPAYSDIKSSPASSSNLIPDDSRMKNGPSAS